MPRAISFFADYHQKENNLSNYCGLILKILYNENPLGFADVITNLVSEEIDITIGPTFTQQQKRKESIPDLSIEQQSFSIFVETKLTDWFYSDQIERHIKGLSGDSKHKILFLLSNFETDDYEDRFSEHKSKAKQDGIILQAISFEDLVDTIDDPEVTKSEAFQHLFEEFKTYLDRNGHLPKWKGLLDVVNCRGSMDEVLDHKVYICSESGGARSHRRARFFGPYANKRVGWIFEIDAIVVVERNLADSTVKWKNITSLEDSALRDRAMQAVKECKGRVEENQATAVQVFLLGNGAETDFKKISRGGMLQSKKYFWGYGSGCKTSSELAVKLKGETWR